MNSLITRGYGENNKIVTRGMSGISPGRVKGNMLMFRGKLIRAKIDSPFI